MDKYKVSRSKNLMLSSRLTLATFFSEKTCMCVLWGSGIFIKSCVRCKLALCQGCWKKIKTLLCYVNRILVSKVSKVTTLSGQSTFGVLGAMFQMGH